MTFPLLFERRANHEPTEFIPDLFPKTEPYDFRDRLRLRFGNFLQSWKNSVPMATTARSWKA